MKNLIYLFKQLKFMIDMKRHGVTYGFVAIPSYLNIRVYKTEDGTYQTKSQDSRGSGNSSNIPSIASQVKFEIKEHFKKFGFGQVTIDCFPFHEIECADKLACQRLSPLEENEKEELFKELRRLI